MNSSAFGKTLKSIRISKGLSAKELASLLEFSPTFLSYIENGAKTIPSYLPDKIIDVLDLSPPEQSDIYASYFASSERIDMPENKDERIIIGILVKNIKDFDENKKRKLIDFIYYED